MLMTVFNFRGTDFKGNRIPESFQHLSQAAHTIRSQFLKQEKKNSSQNDVQFSFSYTTPQNPAEQPITDD